MDNENNNFDKCHHKWSDKIDELHHNCIICNGHFPHQWKKVRVIGSGDIKYTKHRRCKICQYENSEIIYKNMEDLLIGDKKQFYQLCKNEILEILHKHQKDN